MYTSLNYSRKCIVNCFEDDQCVTQSGLDVTSDAVKKTSRLFEQLTSVLLAICRQHLQLHNDVIEKKCSCRHDHCHRMLIVHLHSPVNRRLRLCSDYTVRSAYYMYVCFNEAVNKLVGLLHYMGGINVERKCFSHVIASSKKNKPINKCSYAYTAQSRCEVALCARYCRVWSHMCGIALI